MFGDAMLRFVERAPENAPRLVLDGVDRRVAHAAVGRELLAEERVLGVMRGWRGLPSTTLSKAAPKSLAGMEWAPRRVAFSAVSFTRFARSAPEKPGVLEAMSARLTSGCKGFPFVWTWRIASLAIEAGL